MDTDDSDSKIDKLRFQFKLPDNYEPVYINGVYGGITPRGDLLCHFFYEYMELPEEEIVPFDAGKIDPKRAEYIRREEQEENERVIKRSVRAGITIPIQQVKNIAEWMLRKLEESGIEVETKG